MHQITHRDVIKAFCQKPPYKGHLIMDTVARPSGCPLFRGSTIYLNVLSFSISWIILIADSVILFKIRIWSVRLNLRVGNIWFVCAIDCNVKTLEFTNHIFPVHIYKHTRNRLYHIPRLSSHSNSVHPPNCPPPPSNFKYCMGSIFDWILRF